MAAGSIESRYGWGVALASMAMVTVGFGAMYLIVVGMLPISQEFGWPRGVPSLANGLVWMGAGVGGVIMGWWADRRGAAETSLVAGLALAAGCVMAGTMQGEGALYFSHAVLLGVFGNGALMAPLFANTTRWFDRNRGFALALTGSGQSVAGMIWPPLCRWLMDEYGWREVMIYYGAFSLATIVPLALVLRRQPPAAPVEAQPEGGPPLAAMTLLTGLGFGLSHVLLCAAIITCCIAMAMPIVHLMAHAVDLGFAPARGAEMLALLLACGFVSRLGFGVMADRIGGIRTILVGSVAQGLTLALFIWGDGLVGLYLAAALFGLAFGGLVTTYSFAAREVFPESQAGWRIGIILLSGTFGMAAGGYVGGFVFDMAGHYAVAFLAGVAFNLVNFAIMLFLLLRLRPSRPAAA